MDNKKANNCTSALSLCLKYAEQLDQLRELATESSTTDTATATTVPFTATTGGGDAATTWSALPRHKRKLAHVLAERNLVRVSLNNAITLKNVAEESALSTTVAIVLDACPAPASPALFAVLKNQAPAASLAHALGALHVNYTMIREYNALVCIRKLIQLRKESKSVQSQAQRLQLLQRYVHQRLLQFEALSENVLVEHSKKRTKWDPEVNHMSQVQANIDLVPVFRPCMAVVRAILSSGVQVAPRSREHGRRGECKSASSSYDSTNDVSEKKSSLTRWLSRTASSSSSTATAAATHAVTGRVPVAAAPTAAAASASDDSGVLHPFFISTSSRQNSASSSPMGNNGGAAATTSNGSAAIKRVMPQFDPDHNWFMQSYPIAIRNRIRTIAMQHLNRNFRGNHILYVMQLPRVHDNWALGLCLWLSRRMNLPVLAMLVVPKQLDTSRVGYRKYVAQLHGLTLVTDRLKMLGIPIVGWKHDDIGQIVAAWQNHTRAHMVIVDDMGDATTFRSLKNVVEDITCPTLLVDSLSLVPLRSIDKSIFADAATFDKCLRHNLAVSVPGDFGASISAPAANNAKQLLAQLRITDQHHSKKKTNPSNLAPSRFPRAEQVCVFPPENHVQQQLFLPGTSNVCLPPQLVADTRFESFKISSIEKVHAIIRRIPLLQRQSKSKDQDTDEHSDTDIDRAIYVYGNEEVALACYTALLQATVRRERDELREMCLPEDGIDGICAFISVGSLSPMHCMRTNRQQAVWYPMQQVMLAHLVTLEHNRAMLLHSPNDSKGNNNVFLPQTFCFNNALEAKLHADAPAAYLVQVFHRQLEESGMLYHRGALLWLAFMAKAMKEHVPDAQMISITHKLVLYFNQRSILPLVHVGRLPSVEHEMDTIMDAIMAQCAVSTSTNMMHDDISSTHTSTQV
jgi:hypothetical protein